MAKDTPPRRKSKTKSRARQTSPPGKGERGDSEKTRQKIHPVAPPTAPRHRQQSSQNLTSNRFQNSRQNRFHDSTLINTPSNPAQKNSKKALEPI